MKRIFRGKFGSISRLVNLAVYPPVSRYLSACFRFGLTARTYEIKVGIWKRNSWGKRILLTGTTYGGDKMCSDDIKKIVISLGADLCKIAGNGKV